jgi:hypothetical protein
MRKKIPCAQKNTPVSKQKIVSPNTLLRLGEIKNAIQMYEEQIIYLQQVWEGRIDLKKQGCTPEIRCYQPTREDKQRLPHTLANLHQQIRILAHEREALKIYGR